MSANSDIINSIRTITESSRPYAILCTVAFVDLENKLCDCEAVDGDANLLDVKLMADNKTGFYIIPVIGSKVYVTLRSEQTGYVSMFSEIEEIQLNGDDNGGLVKASDLITALNNSQNDMNTLKSIISSWAPVPSDGGAALKALLTTWASSSLSITTTGDVSSETVKHGNG